MLKALKRFVREESGLETVEWALVGGLVVVAAAALWTQIGSDVNTQINALEAAIPDTAPSVGGGGSSGS